MIVQSANACAVALAELIAGNEHTFVNQMREQLRVGHQRRDNH